MIKRGALFGRGDNIGVYNEETKNWGAGERMRVARQRNGIGKGCF